MNIFFKAIQKSFDLLEQKKVQESSFMKALEYMQKIAHQSEYETETCTINANQNKDIVVVIETPTKMATLTITADNNGISYTGTGPGKEDQIHTINNASYSVSDTIFEWIKRNRKQ